MIASLMTDSGRSIARQPCLYKLTVVSTNRASQVFFKLLAWIIFFILTTISIVRYQPCDFGSNQRMKNNYSNLHALAGFVDLDFGFFSLALAFALPLGFCRRFI